MRQLILIVIMAGMFAEGYPQNPLPADLVAQGAKVEKAGTGYSFTEGSSTASDGSVYFTDQPNDRIYKWTEKKGVSLFMQGTGRSNGTYFDKNGDLIACADLHNALIRISSDKRTDVVYDKGFENKHFNGPNDLWIHPEGGIYFTDPYYHRNYWPSGHSQVQDVQGVYFLSSGGKLTRVIDDLQQPNGIVGSADGKFLFVADIRGGTTWKYTINSNGTLTNKTFFAQAGSDGMTIDQHGNIYLTYGKVLVFSPSGEKLGEIELPESPSNLCFAGKKKNILFITARTSVYTINMKVKGVE